jgi:hypothetical protein
MPMLCFVRRERSALEAAEPTENELRVSVLVEHHLHDFVDSERDTASGDSGSVQTYVIHFAARVQDEAVEDYDKPLCCVGLSIGREIVLCHAPTHGSSDVDTPVCLLATAPPATDKKARRVTPAKANRGIASSPFACLIPRRLEYDTPL